MNKESRLILEDIINLVLEDNTNFFVGRDAKPEDLGTASDIFDYMVKSDRFKENEELINNLMETSENIYEDICVYEICEVGKPFDKEELEIIKQNNKRPKPQNSVDIKIILEKENEVIFSLSEYVGEADEEFVNARKNYTEEDIKNLINNPNIGIAGNYLSDEEIKKLFGI